MFLRIWVDVAGCRHAATSGAVFARRSRRQPKVCFRCQNWNGLWLGPIAKSPFKQILLRITHASLKILQRDDIEKNYQRRATTIATILRKPVAPASNSRPCRPSEKCRQQLCLLMKAIKSGLDQRREHSELGGTKFAIVVGPVESLCTRRLPSFKGRKGEQVVEEETGRRL